MQEDRVSIPLGHGLPPVSGIMTLPTAFQPGTGTGIIIAHGAANTMELPLLVAFTRGLAKAGYPSLRFNFPYSDQRKKSPDPQMVLEQTWLAASHFFARSPQYKPAAIVGAGKSMGGRVMAQLMAKKAMRLEKLIFLGYPLHAPGRKEQLRAAHLYEIIVPQLYFAGTRDSLCDLGSMQTVLNKLPAPWKLEIIEGGDHSFHLPKTMGREEAEVFKTIIEKTIRWLT
ncbi:MAG: dienelactone hydrolase family protein [Deltaproteobacteria bacterium]|nr:dienelactone hydrolase family protein [Candidatus Anaeroferrophillus wilburensis]MBN2890203.1 dienelactone hydrolase family protein [Deltaproteobacteria bacterium]